MGSESPESSVVPSCSDELTSLSWLSTLGSPFSPPSTRAPARRSTRTRKKLLVHQRTNVNKLMEHYERLCLTNDFVNDKKCKPPFSYAALICLALMKSRRRMTLSQIYEWIRKNFAFFRNAQPCWQNSIRHNLSLNKCFAKVARAKGERGKGGFWTLIPNDAPKPNKSKASKINKDGNANKERSGDNESKQKELCLGSDSGLDALMYEPSWSSLDVSLDMELDMYDAKLDRDTSPSEWVYNVDNTNLWLNDELEALVDLDQQL